MPFKEKGSKLLFMTRHPMGFYLSFQVSDRRSLVSPAGKPAVGFVKRLFALSVIDILNIGDIIIISKKNNCCTCHIPGIHPFGADNKLLAQYRHMSTIQRRSLLRFLPFATNMYHRLLLQRSWRAGYILTRPSRSVFPDRQPGHPATAWLFLHRFTQWVAK